jgi:TRAP-type C4-dicarboxylate transport system substrate-binding protein
VWVPQSDRIAQATYAAGGVSPIALPLSDVYTALQTGMVDTVGNTMSGTIAFQWHTRVKHMIDLPLTYVMGILAIDKKAFEKMSAEDQAVVRAEIGKAFDRIDAQARVDNDKARETLLKMGIQPFKPDATEAGYWAQIGEDARNQMLANGDFTPEVYAALRAALDEYRARSGSATP